MSGKAIRHYNIEEKLGERSVGLVHNARNATLCRDAALKVLPENALSHSEAGTRFRREPLAFSQINYPNIEVVHEFDSHDDINSLVTEYLPGAITVSVDYITFFSYNGDRESEREDSCQFSLLKRYKSITA